MRAAKEVIRVQIAAYEVGIGDCWLVAPARVANWTRIGAGAMGPDIEEARIDPSNRASARGDRHHIERGHVHLPARDNTFGDFERGAAEPQLVTGVPGQPLHPLIHRAERIRDRASRVRAEPGYQGCAGAPQLVGHRVVIEPRQSPVPRSV